MNRTQTTEIDVASKQNIDTTILVGRLIKYLSDAEDYERVTVAELVESTGCSVELAIEMKQSYSKTKVPPDTPTATWDDKMCPQCSQRKYSGHQCNFDIGHNFSQNDRDDI